MRRIPQMAGCYNDPRLVSVYRTDLRLLLAVARAADKLINQRAMAKWYGGVEDAVNALNAKPRKP